MSAEPTAAELAGKRYIAYSRSAARNDASVDRQLGLIRQFAERLGLVCVGEVRLNGVGGYLPPLRPDLCALLARKRTKNDFDLLVMEDRARLTRTHQFDVVETAFADHGIRIVYVCEVAGDLA